MLDFVHVYLCSGWVMEWFGVDEYSCCLLVLPACILVVLVPSRPPMRWACSGRQQATAGQLRQGMQVRYAETTSHLCGMREEERAVRLGTEAPRSALNGSQPPLVACRVLGIDVCEAVTKALTVDEEATIPYVTQVRMLPRVRAAACGVGNRWRTARPCTA